MGAVDRCDQMVAYSCFTRRTMKWWKKVFFHLFSLSILNSYILYKERTRSPLLQRVFRRELVKELVCSSGISPSSTPRGRPRRSVECLTRLQAGSHFPENIKVLRRRPTSQDHALFVFLPKRRFWLELERRGRGQGGSLVSNAMFAKWDFEFKTVFSCTTPFRTMYLPMLRGMIQIIMHIYDDTDD